jgi:hypothetical protein
MTTAFQLTAGGDLARVNGRLQRIDSTAQRIACRLRLLRGEWFLNKADGVPYIDQVVGQKTNVPHLRQLFSEEIRAVEGVTSLDRLDVIVNQRTRVLRVEFQVNGGEVVSFTLQPTR